MTARRPTIDGWAGNFDWMLRQKEGGLPLVERLGLTDYIAAKEC